MVCEKYGFAQSMDYPTQSNDRYSEQQTGYEFVAQSMDCLFGTVHKVRFKQTRCCFVLRSLLI